MKKPTKHKHQSQQAIRIIAGKWRRRQLPVADVEGLRPTGNRIRETLFNWLSPYIVGAKVLDLFAGTGALGIEAMSRGAHFVQFIERHPHACRQLQNNLSTLKPSTSEFAIEQADGITWLNNAQTPNFDLIFLDPPFADDLWSDCYRTLEANQLLSSGTLIYVESPIETKLSGVSTHTTPPNWKAFRSLKAGQVSAQLFEYTPS